MPLVVRGPAVPAPVKIGRGNDTVGSPHGAQISQCQLVRAQVVRFELFKFILLLKLDNRLPIEQVERFEAAASQSADPPLFIFAPAKTCLATPYLFEKEIPS